MRLEFSVLAQGVLIAFTCFHVGCHSNQAILPNQSVALSRTSAADSSECRLSIDQTLEETHLRRLSHFEVSAYCAHSSLSPFFRIVNFRVEDYQYAVNQNRIFIHPRLHDLPVEHSYNYILTTSGELVIGMVLDAWEFGVKHLHLAQGRDVLVAGELLVNADSSYSFNLMSGTLMMPIAASHPEYNSRLELAIQSFFLDEFGSRGLFLKTGTLLPLSVQPTPEEKSRFCDFSDFSLRNPQVCAGTEALSDSSRETLEN